MRVDKNNAFISFSNYLIKVNSLIMSYVPKKKTRQVTTNISPEALAQKKWYKTPIRKGTNFFQNISNVKILLQKMIYIENIKVIEISCPQPQKKVKESIMMVISELILKILKTRGKT